MRTKKRRVLSFISLSFALIIMTTLMLGSVVMAAPTSDMLVIDNADMKKNRQSKVHYIRFINKPISNMSYI